MVDFNIVELCMKSLLDKAASIDKESSKEDKTRVYTSIASLLAAIQTPVGFSGDKLTSLCQYPYFLKEYMEQPSAVRLYKEFNITKDLFDFSHTDVAPAYAIKEAMNDLRYVLIRVFFPQLSEDSDEKVTRFIYIPKDMHELDGYYEYFDYELALNLSSSGKIKLANTIYDALHRELFTRIVRI